MEATMDITDERFPIAKTITTTKTEKKSTIIAGQDLITLETGATANTQTTTTTTTIDHQGNKSSKTPE